MFRSEAHIFYYKSWTEKLKEICKKLEQQRFNMDNKDANRLIGTAALMVPTSSQESLQRAAPLIVGASCVQADIPVDIIKVAGSEPSQKILIEW